MFGDNIHESKLEAVMALAALLQGPYEVGNNILAREGIVELMLAMADSGNAIYTVSFLPDFVVVVFKQHCLGIIRLHALTIHNIRWYIGKTVCCCMFVQKYAVEALVHSASKKERCSGVIKQATPILKTLYQSQNDTIKVRALVVSDVV